MVLRALFVFVVLYAVSLRLVSSWEVGVVVNRRQVIALSLGTGFGLVAASSVAHAACLPGDLSPDCIGVYKVPIDDCLSEALSSKEALQRYAPELNYIPPLVPPPSASAAYKELYAQRETANDIATIIAAGRLEEAGIKVLNLIPRVTLSGRVLIDATLTSNPIINTSSSSIETVQELRRQQITKLLETTNVAWNEVDIMIGQGLRGTLGVSAVAQLLILAEIRLATAALDDFILAVKT